MLPMIRPFSLFAVLITALFAWSSLGARPAEYPLFRETLGDGPRQARAAALEQELGIAASAEKVGEADKIVRGYLYEKPRTREWGPALKAAEYMDLVGNPYGAYYIAMLVVAEGAAYPDYGVYRQMLERGAGSSVEWLRGNAAGLLGDLYRFSYGVPRDYQRAAELYRQGADNGNSAAARALGFLWANGYLGAPRLDEGLVWYRKAKEMGLQVEGLDATIESLANGTYKPVAPISFNQPVEFDVVEWHRRAETGNALAAAELATLYGRGLGGVGYARKTADYWRARAAAGGIVLDGEAMQEGSEVFWKSLSDQGAPLGKGYYAYYLDTKEPSSRELFLKLCDEAIAAGYPRGYFRKASAFLDKENATKAIALYEEAAAMGYYLGYAEIALIYYNGTHIDRDYEKAIRYAQSSQQHHTSLNVLGLCYLDGKGVEKDQVRAVGYFRQALDAGGDQYPAYNLARCYANGWGVAVDLNAAREWALDAADLGHGPSKSLIADIDAGVYTPRVPPTAGTAYAVNLEYGSQLPQYGDFRIEGATSLYRIFNYREAAWALARVKSGPHEFDALLSTDAPGSPTAQWTLRSTLPSLIGGKLTESRGLWLAYKDEGFGVASTTYRSVDGVVWTEGKAPASFQEIHGLETGFLGVATSNDLYISRDGTSWELAMDKLKLGSYFAPYNVGKVSVSGGWIVVTPDFGYVTAQATAPVLVSRDGKSWSELARIDRSENLSNASAAVVVSKDLAVVSLYLGSATRRDLVFRGGEQGGVAGTSGSGVFGQLFDVGGNIFALGYYSVDSAVAYLRHTGLSGPSAKSRPEAAAPVFMDLRRLYTGEALPYGALAPAAVVGDALLAPTTARPGRYFYISGFQSAPAQAGDLAKLAGAALKPAADRPSALAAKEGAEAKRLVEERQAKADGGDLTANYSLGTALLNGDAEVLKNEYLGLHYLGRAAAKRHGPANSALGRYWSTKDKERSESYYKIALELGDASGIFNYVEYLASGRYHPMAKKEFDRAIAIVKPLAESGNAVAKNWEEFLELEKRVDAGYDAAAYHDIIALRRRPDTGLPSWFGTTETKAKMVLAENGDPAEMEAAFEAARTGNDEAGMKKWLAKLVDNGHPTGLYYAALATFQGTLGYTKDEAGGIAKIVVAAEAGSVAAIKEVTAFYARGLHGYTKSVDEAKAWAERAKALGETEWAVAYIMALEAEAKAADRRLPVDGKVANIGAKVMEQLRFVQDAADVSALAKERAGYVFAAVWWDADYSADEQDLVRELLNGLNVTVVGADGVELRFTKPPPASDHDTWRAMFPDPFPLSDTNFPLTSWNYAATPGPFVMYSRNPATRDAARSTLAQALYSEIANRVKQAEQTRNVGYVSEFSTVLLNRAKAGDAASGKQFALIVYSIIKDDIKANPQLLGYFSELSTYANAQ